MSGLKTYDVDPADLDPNGIAENQTTAGAANLTLDGALCDLGTAGQFDIGDAYSAGIGGVKILIDAAGDVSGVTFTVTGKDQNGNSITEDITGVTTTAVSSTNYWSQITQIAADGAVGSNVFVGTITGELSTPWVVLNHLSDSAAMTAVSGLTGTCQYDIQETYTNILNDGTENAVAFTKVSNQSTNQTNVLSQGVTGCRLVFDSYSNGAELQFTVSYNPYR